MNVYLVVDIGNCPGRVYAVFADKDDADTFASNLEGLGKYAEVFERTLFFGQPPVRGYNK